MSKRVSEFRNIYTDRLPFTFLRCKECGFIFVYPRRAADLNYVEGQVIEMGENSHLWNTRFIEAIEKQKNNQGRLLEIGFGDGGFIEISSRRGWDAYGIELSVDCVKHARERLGLKNILHGTIFSADLEYEYFDVICAFNYIEHVSDVNATLRRIYSLLKDDGIIVLLCPNIDGLYHRVIPELFGGKDSFNITWVPPYHISYFNKNNLSILLENNGFKVIADESNLTNLLWMQHNLIYGPKACDIMETEIKNKIRSNSSSNTNASCDDIYFNDILNLVRCKSIWTMLTTIMPLESLINSPNALLLISRKA